MDVTCELKVIFINFMFFSFSAFRRSCLVHPQVLIFLLEAVYWTFPRCCCSCFCCCCCCCCCCCSCFCCCSCCRCCCLLTKAGRKRKLLSEKWSHFSPIRNFPHGPQTEHVVRACWGKTFWGKFDCTI